MIDIAVFLAFSYAAFHYHMEKFVVKNNREGVGLFFVLLVSIYWLRHPWEAVPLVRSEPRFSFEPPHLYNQPRNDKPVRMTRKQVQRKARRRSKKVQSLCHT